MYRLLLVLALFFSGCGIDAPDPRFGINLLELRYQFFRPDSGVAPSTSILRDPNNPFAVTGVANDVEAFAISEVGSGTASYYAWGTLLANEGPVDPGVAQFFAAQGLLLIYFADEITDDTDPEDVRLQAIAAHQSVLDNYPATQLDLTGEGLVFARLATQAYLAIEDLGGVVRGNWELIEYVDEDGNVRQVAIQGGDSPIKPPEFEPDTSDDEDENGEG